MFRKFLLIAVAIALLANLTFSQDGQNKKISAFSTRLIKPVDVDIQENSSGASITITNQSYFRYTVIIEFTSVVNLRIAAGMKRFYELPYGTIHGQSIPSINSDSPIDLSYNVQLQISPSNFEKGDFIYLYPIGNNKNLRDYLYKSNETIYRNMFSMKKGDTVFCMRKGIVTNLIRNEGLADRLGPEGSVEILHEDGTVMVYTGISRNPENLKRGNIVYPDQPIGIMEDEQNVLTAKLYFIQPDAGISQMNIKYPTDCFTSLAKSTNSDCLVTHPGDLIQSEMSKAEKKKYVAGKLYLRD